ncbi:hypothetical protein GCM10009845_21880 [Pedococcus bigeumensis]
MASDGATSTIAGNGRAQPSRTEAPFGMPDTVSEMRPPSGPARSTGSEELCTSAGAEVGRAEVTTNVGGAA